MRRWIVVSGVTVLVLAGAGTAAWFVVDDSASASGQETPRIPATADVERGDLVDTKTVSGTLGYAGERTLVSGLSGTLTWAPAPGATLTQGKALYAVDRKPVTLMYGNTPMYRTLDTSAADGPDVRQLEADLAKLGYTGFTVDDDYTSATADAVSRWQADHGLDQTGAVDSAQILFRPGQLRVREVKAAVGDKVAAGKAILDVNDQSRLVTVPLDVVDQEIARTGAAVSIELPDNSMTKGKISKVGTVATAPASSGNSTSTATPTITVEVTLDDPKKVGSLDQAPVSVTMQSETHKNVLSVPIEALLALKEGGYGLQVVEGAATRIIAVEVGMFAGGRVEVSGGGVAAGMKVGVPRT
ncbi:peptidoglycan-binding protein [Actinoplanes sp. NPDC026619]|uniref:peptidoglycan-binding protein n=1 Tax=Actinoplanes sp. NPDC026619 TaxID=3155798 RepID=UPI0033E4EC13